MRQAIAQEGDQLALGHRAVRPTNDAGLDAFAPGGVGHADHRAVGHAGMLHQRVLDLGRIDVLATRDDHVLDAVVDVEVAALQVTTVAAAEPAAARVATVREHRRSGLGVAPIADHVAGRLDQHLAGLAVGQVGQRAGLDHPQPRTGHRLTG